MSSSFPALYALLDAALVPGREVQSAGQLAKAGVRLIQYRNKAASSRDLFEVCRALLEKLAPFGVRLVVNDRPDIAAICGAGGVHLGQEDLPIELARRCCPSRCWVGISTHNIKQVREAETTSADYIAVGPIFATATKADLDPVVGTEFLRRARELTRKPLVAIGGITLERAEELYRAGANSLAVARDLLAAPDPADRARRFLEIARSARRTRN